jgi:serine protease Do
MLIEPFYVGTYEDRANSSRHVVFNPPSENPFAPFLIQDPFGLRKAIVPVFKRDTDGEIRGMGTAFHVDGWGTFLTADHVIEFAREYSNSASTWTEISHNSNGDHIVLLLGVGLIMGEINTPEEAFAFVEYVVSPMQEKDNPLANRTEPKNLADVAAMIAVIQPETKRRSHPHSVPVKASGSCPSIGETVLAIGFPELECQRLDEHEQGVLLSEGMYGAYGCVTAIHPRGRSESKQTPVFEVECNWRSGMSGGPVFNSSGEVIGLVSSGMDFSSDVSSNGLGWATCFSLIPYFNEVVPTLDILNPTNRRGWAVLRSEPWHLAGFFRTEVEAQQLASSMSGDYQVKYGLNSFGTDDFITYP